MLTIPYFILGRMDEADSYMRKIQRQKRELTLTEHRMTECNEAIHVIAKKLAIFMNDTTKR